MAKATGVKVDIQSGSDRTVYATWNWSKSHTSEYKVKWYYYTGDGVAFIGSDTTTTAKQSTYSAPENAYKIGFKVKPISKKHKVNKKEVSYWTADWSTIKYYSLKNNPPSTPPVPTVTIEDYKLTAELTNLDVNATQIEFQVVKNDKSVFKSGKATIETTSASFSCTVTAGGEYKVRCRSIRKKEKSGWSEYSSAVGTIPSASKGIHTIKALSETSVFLDWTNVSTATSYEVQYTSQKRYFDSSPENVKSTTVDATVCHAEITGLDTGQEWFFRVRAVNDKGNSGWTDIVSIVLGKDPAAPTTWSSASTVIVGEPLTLYWVHNAEDGSSQTYAELEMYIDGLKETYTIKNTTDEEEKDKTSSYSIDTSKYVEGTQIQWRVRTAGATKAYGDWSVQRTVDIYAQPTLELSITDQNGRLLETLTSFPFYIKGLAGPDTQTPIGYHLSVIANESYETLDQIGNEQMISEGAAVYSKYFDTSEELLVEMWPSNIDLENNVNYTVKCSVSMNSGLTTENSLDFIVSWTDVGYDPDAEIGYDEDTLSTYIKPYCEDENGDLIGDVTLSVYRREFDGSFIEIGTNIPNFDNVWLTDPHPALDYARYRIVAITTQTGTVSYYDMPGYPIGEKAVIIQWDEKWSNFDVTNEDEYEEPPWSGSLLKLPYNIDVSDSNKPDVSLVEYIGRKYPVSYYGTQLGSTSTWNMDIVKSDKETLYGLRRLMTWMGDVYVREPSGSGYWANITVTFNQKHCELTIPVTLTISRVEGGV